MTAKTFFILTLLTLTLVIFPTCLINAQTSNTKVNLVPAQNSTREGDTIAFNLTISNVVNLYAIDVIVDWNSTVLQLQNVSLQLGVQTHPGGTLYGEPVSTSITPGGIYTNTTQTQSEYQLVATSVAPADSFNGSGTIATLTFNVTSAGNTQITLQSDLADHPQPGETTSDPIPHTDSGAQVEAAAIPEFPQVIMVTVIVIAATATALLMRKGRRKENGNKQ